MRVKATLADDQNFVSVGIDYEISDVLKGINVVGSTPPPGVSLNIWIRFLMVTEAILNEMLTFDCIMQAKIADKLDTP